MQEKKDMSDEELEKLTMQLWSGTIDKKTFERMRNRRIQERIFGEELEKLQALLRDKIIDEDTCVRLRKLFEIAFT